MGLLMTVAGGTAAAPLGLYEARVLEPAASFLAGKLAHVYCAVTDDDWREYAKANTTPDVGGHKAAWFTCIRTSPPGATAPTFSRRGVTLDRVTSA